MPVAMEMFLVAGERSWSIGTFTFPRSNGTWSTNLDADIQGFEEALANANAGSASATGTKGAQAVIVELRPSIDAAQRAVGFDEILGQTVSLPATVDWLE